MRFCPCCFARISRKMPPSELPAAVTGKSFCPLTFSHWCILLPQRNCLHPSDSSSPDLSCLCRHYSCWETGRTFTSHPLAILVAGLRRFDNLFIKVHFYEQIRHLCYGNACADFIPFWFVFLSKKEKKMLILCILCDTMCLVERKKKIFVIHSLFVKVYFYEQIVESTISSSKDN